MYCIHVFSGRFSMIIILINRGNIFLHPSEFLHNPLRPKRKVVLVPEIGRVKIFYHLPARISRMCMRIYIFFVSKNTHLNKKFSVANLLARTYVFSLQTIKERALCFSAKKSAVRIAF